MHEFIDYVKRKFSVIMKKRQLVLTLNISFFFLSVGVFIKNYAHKFANEL